MSGAAKLCTARGHALSVCGASGGGNPGGGNPGACDPGGAAPGGRATAYTPALRASVRRAAVALVTVACAATAQRPAVAQTPRFGPFGSIFEEPPHLVVRPMAAFLAGGRAEQRLDARMTWSTAGSPSAFGLGLVAGLVLAPDLYTRSGLHAALRSDLGRLHVGGAATLGSGIGAGPRRFLSFSFDAGLPAIRLDVRTTWFQDEPADSVPVSVDTLPGFAAGAPRRYGSLRDGRYADGELNVHHRFGPVALRLTGGMRFGGDGRGVPRWLFGAIEVPVWHRVGLGLAGGVRPDRSDLGQVGGGFVQLSLQLDVGAAEPPPVVVPEPPAVAPSVVPLGPGRYRLRLWVPGASIVELKGDVTDWRVAGLRRSSSVEDAWEAILERPAGVYHVNIRVDGGEWVVPRGLVVVPDRFGGYVGVLNLPLIEEERDAKP